MALPARELRRIQQQITLQEETAAKGERARASKHINAAKRRQAADQLEGDMIEYQKKESSWLDAIPEAPTFRPTVKQFEDPLAYIRSIQKEAAASGICKIIPPVPAVVPGGMVLSKTDIKGFKFTTRQQQLAEPRRASFASMTPFTDGTRKYTVPDFERMADEAARKRFGCAGNLPPRLVESEYWRVRAEGGDAYVEYGNDVEGSAFCDRDPLGSSHWNMKDLPRGEESALRELTYAVPGVSSPMLYLGMLFSNFAWHVEDHWLYSINYQHLGASKTWYGVPASSADGFEKVALESVLSTAAAARRAGGASRQEASFSAARHLLRKTTMFSPQLLVDAGVKVTRVVQNPGDIVVTFPRSYHSGFSNGFCIGEATNFTLVEWFAYAAEARRKYRALRKAAILPFEHLLVRQFPVHADAKLPPPGCPSGTPAGIAQQVLARHMRSLNTARGKVARGGTPMQRLPDGVLCCHCSQCGDMVSLAIAVVRGDGASEGGSKNSSSAEAVHNSGNVPRTTGGGSPALVKCRQLEGNCTHDRVCGGDGVSSSAPPPAVSPAVTKLPAVPQATAEQRQPQPQRLLCLPCLAESDVRDGDDDSTASSSRDSVGATVLFLHPDLECMEALARKLENDPRAALHGDLACLSLGGLPNDAFVPMEPFQWSEVPMPAAGEGDEARLRDLELSISVAIPMPDPDEAANAAELAAEALAKGGDNSASGRSPSSRKLLPGGRSKGKTYLLSSGCYSRAGDSTSAGGTNLAVGPSGRPQPVASDQSGSAAVKLEPSKATPSVANNNGCPQSVAGGLLAISLQPESLKVPAGSSNVRKPGIPSLQRLRMLSTPALNHEGHHHHHQQQQGARCRQQQPQVAAPSPTSSADAVTPPKADVVQSSALEFSAALHSEAAQQLCSGSRPRHSSRKRKATVAHGPVRAAADSDHVRAGKRRPSTVAATAACQQAREAAAANAAAAAARWDRRPPTFERSAWDERALLNTAEGALLCVDDSSVELSPAAPDISIRRRIFSPPGAEDERYLLAREVVKASGVEYNTSAPNVVQRWFRAIMRRAKAHLLPLPSLPRRALLADGSHSRGCGAAAGVDVLSAEEVMMVAWVVDAAARERLDAFTAGAWPSTPSLLRSRHLQGLLRLQADQSPSPDTPKNQGPALELQHSMAGAGNLESALGGGNTTTDFDATIEGRSVTTGFPRTASAAAAVPPLITRFCHRLHPNTSAGAATTFDFPPDSSPYPYNSRPTPSGGSVLDGSMGTLLCQLSPILTSAPSEELTDPSRDHSLRHLPAVLDDNCTRQPTSAAVAPGPPWSSHTLEGAGQLYCPKPMTGSGLLPAGIVGLPAALLPALQQERKSINETTLSGSGGTFRPAPLRGSTEALLARLACNPRSNQPNGGKQLSLPVAEGRSPIT